MSDSSKLILVTGDPICDHNYYRGNRHTADSAEKRGFRFLHSGGGSLLLKELIETAISDLSEWKTEFGLDDDYMGLPPTYHAFCLWEPQVCPDEGDDKKSVQVWRAVLPALGYGHDTLIPEESGKPSPEAIRPRKEPTGKPDILVIDDAGLGFREPRHRDAWPTESEEGGAKWIVIKLTGEIGEGELWKSVTKASPDNFVVVVTADQLRRSDVRLSEGLSWEATAEDLSAELKGNPILKPFLAARHLIVTFRSDAAFWLNNTRDGTPTSMLVFDAERAEGEWEQSQGDGAVFGVLSCLTASVVRGLCEHAEDPDIESALIAGLGASRKLLSSGHGPVLIPNVARDGKPVQMGDAKPVLVDNPHPGFPFGAIAQSIRNPKGGFVSAPIPHDLAPRGEWMMLNEWHVHAAEGKRQRPHNEAALAVAVLGPGALERFPVARFGFLQTVDRKEIESLRTLRSLIESYEKLKIQKKPLCLGVFGPPGAGKSFGVSQIALSVLRIKEEEILTFNLSQYSDPEELIGAFHRVRDRVVTGKTPFVFWDEFDSQGYRWLQYLLAPMQDGAFQEGQITHPIGKCVFVFAGATSATFEMFGPIDPTKHKDIPEERRHDAEEKWLDFVLKKGPDFQTRLVGYLNVLGPNLRQRCVEEKGRRTWEDDFTDLCCPIRRALFIRAQFKLKPRARLEIDRGVLCALLEVSRFKAGARSLEFLCQHLRSQAGNATPRRSHLPGRQLLEMHVDAEEFLGICEAGMAFSPAREELAEGLHAAFRSKLKPEDLAKPSGQRWKDLEGTYRTASLAQAARIPQVLAIANLKIRKAKSGEVMDEAVPARLEQDLEILAETEHNHWMVERMLNGWRYAKKRDNPKKLHPLLIPYAQLPETEKDKDREAIREYVKLVGEAGFIIE